MTHLHLLRLVDLSGVRERGSILPNELPRFQLLGRLLLKKGLARQNSAGRWVRNPVDAWLTRRRLAAHPLPPEDGT